MNAGCRCVIKVTGTHESHSKESMNRTRHIITWGVLFAFLLTSGCASIVSKSSYPVTINSTPEQANITITDEKGEKVFAGQTPTTVTLDTKAGYFKGKSYNVTIAKEGYSEQTIMIKSEMDGWYIGNLLFGGLVGMLIVDPLTGAMWKLEPQDVNANLVESTSSLDTSEMALQVVLLEDVPENLRVNMIRVK